MIIERDTATRAVTFETFNTAHGDVVRGDREAIICLTLIYLNSILELLFEMNSIE